MKSSELRNIRGTPWKTTWTSQDIENVFSEFGPFEGFYNMSMFNLAWFVEQIFVKNGRPLKLLPFQQVILDVLWYK